MEDVRNRRDTVAILKHERNMALAEDKARSEKKQAALEEKQAVSNQSLSLSHNRFKHICARLAFQFEFLAVTRQ